MEDFFEQECPLCQAQAEYCYVDYENRKYFGCPTCRQFQISARAEKEIIRRSNSRRQQYSRCASGTSGKELFVIVMAGPEIKQKTGDDFDARYWPKSDVPTTCR